VYEENVDIELGVYVVWSIKKTLESRKSGEVDKRAGEAKILK